MSVENMSVSEIYQKKMLAYQMEFIFQFSTLVFHRCGNHDITHAATLHTTNSYCNYRNILVTENFMKKREPQMFETSDWPLDLRPELGQTIPEEDTWTRAESRRRRKIFLVERGEWTILALLILAPTGIMASTSQPCPDSRKTYLGDGFIQKFINASKWFSSKPNPDYSIHILTSQICPDYLWVPLCLSSTYLPTYVYYHLLISSPAYTLKLYKDLRPI